jgi:thiol-disulfide isomerase/thioredoxin
MHIECKVYLPDLYSTLQYFVMKTMTKIFFAGLFLLCSMSVVAQKISVSGKATGEIAKMLKEVQFFCDGSLQRLILKKEDKTFTGEILIKQGQFVEINSGNPKPQAYFLVPNEKITIAIDKPSMNESITVITNNKTEKLQDIFSVYFKALEEKGINIKAREWQQLLFVNKAPLAYAESKLNAELVKQKAFVATVPNFKRDVLLFMKSFRKYTEIDTMSLATIEASLQEIKTTASGVTALTIPYYKDYLTDLTNAYAAKTLEKYGITYDAIKQKHFSQFIAAEAISKYIPDFKTRSYLFSDKLKVELPVNGLKNEDYVNYLYNNSEQFVKDLYQEKIDLLKANKAPDLSTARKKAFNFLLHDSTGKEYRLDDFKGKMLFIDFWASWCAPCKAQIPYQKELEKHYAGKDLIFMSVSLDKSKPAWLKAVKEEDLHGYVLHAEGDFKNAFPKNYAIESIPRYMLIDAEGNIISDNMMKPQNKKEMMAVIDEELYAKNTASILEKHFKAIGAEVLLKNGVDINFRQSVMTMVANGNILYSYPKKVKFAFKMEETEQMRMMVGKEFFKETVTIMNGDSVSTNNPANANFKNSWIDRMFGLQLFLRKSIYNSAVKFAEESSSGSDSSYVLKLTINGNIEKYFINKKTHLIDKVVLLTAKQDARKGGGYFEAVTQYEDYRNVNGLMIPFKINQSNIITIKIEKAEVRPAGEFFDGGK